MTNGMNSNLSWIINLLLFLGANFFAKKANKKDAKRENF
jgi:hypothetical protein